MIIIEMHLAQSMKHGPCLASINKAASAASYFNHASSFIEAHCFLSCRTGITSLAVTPGCCKRWVPLIKQHGDKRGG